MTFEAKAMAFVAFIIAGWVSADILSIRHELHEQTAILHQIEMNTEAPVRMQLDGFSPDVQKVFDKAQGGSPHRVKHD